MAYLMTLLLALISTLLPLWLGQRAGLIRWVSPMHLLALFAGLGFALKVVVFGYAPDLAFYARFIDTPDAILRGAIYLSLFILLMCLGYASAVRPSDRVAALADARLIAAGVARQGWLFVAAFGVAGLTLALILQARGVAVLDAATLADLNSSKQINVNAAGVGATLAGVKTLFVVPKLAFVLLLAQGIVRQDWRRCGMAVTLGALLVSVAVVTGDRFELVELMVFTVATFAIVGARIGPLGIIGACMAVAGLIVISALMTLWRGAEAGLWQQIVGSTYFLDINAATMVTDRVTPEMQLWGESYGWWVFGWVPRVFWLEKPAVDLGVYFKAVVMGLPTGGAFNVTGPGEAFINFGWAGAGVGFVLGWIFRRAEEATLASSHVLRHGAVFYYPLLVYPFVQACLQSSFSAFIVGAAAQAVLMAAVITLCLPRYRATPTFSKQELRSQHDFQDI